MDHHILISWGVSFGSMTMVAGVVAFFGFTNRGTLTQSHTAAESFNQYEQSQEQWGSQQPSEGQFNQGGNDDYSSLHRQGHYGSGSGQPNTDNRSQFQTPSGQEQYDTRTGGTSF